MELLLSFTRAICKNSGLIQYSADVSKHLLITHCKHLFERTNKGKSYAEQVVCILDREEAMRQFDVYTLLQSSDTPLINAIYDEGEAVTAADPTHAWVARVLPKEQWQIHLPCPVRNHFVNGKSIFPVPVRNHFVNGILSDNAQTALHVAARPDETNLLLNNLTVHYHLHDFEVRYQEYLHLHSHDTHPLLHAFDHISLWYKCRVQLHSIFRPSMIMPSQVVQARPPSSDFPHGCCDAVLITPPDDGM